MRINYKNYPCLEFFINRNANIFKIDSMNMDLQQSSIIFNDCLKNISSVLKSVSIFSQTISSKIIQPNLYPKLHDLVTNEPIKINGVVIYGKFVWFINIDTNKLFNDNGKLTVVCCLADGRILYYANGNNSVVYSGICEEIMENAKKNGEIEDNVSINKFITVHFIYAIMFKFFQKYAQVETKIIQPNEKYKIEKDNIFNETKLPITYIDSTWFTNLIISGAFSVRGHFRLQPKKNEKGEWTKELIWIKDFEKQGYHRQAKILNEGNSNEQV